MKLDKTFDPITVLSAAGYSHTGFLRVGDGPWTGIVTIDGHEYTVDEMQRSWKVTTPSGVNVSGAELVAVLKTASTRSKR